MRHFVMSQKDDTVYPADILVIYTNHDNQGGVVNAFSDGNSNDLFVCPQGQGGSMVSHMSMDWFSSNVMAL